MKIVCIIYNADVANWPPYITKSLQESQHDLKVSSILDTQLMVESNSTQLQSTPLLILILSPGFVEQLQSTDLTFAVNSTTKRLLIAPVAELILFYCGVDEADLRAADRLNQPIAKKLPHCAEKFHHEQYAEFVKQIEKRVKRKKPINMKKSNGAIKVVPSNAAAEGGTELCLIFMPPNVSPDGDHLKVDFPTDVDEWVSVDAVWHADNVYSVVAPEHPVGEVTARVTESGKELGVFKLKFTSIYYDVISGMNQLYSTIIDRLVDNASSQITIEQIDKTLASAFDKDLSETISAQTFEKFFGIYSYSVNDSIHKLPTPLHLVAKWNLEQLAKKYLDLPDAKGALSIQSSDHKTPIQLARSRKNVATAELLEKNCGDTEEFEEIYETFLKYHSRDNSETSSTSNIASATTFCTTQNVFQPADSTNLTNRKFLAKAPPVCITVIAEPAEKKSNEIKLQDDLIHIMNQVKSKEISQEEALLLFKELKIKENSQAASKKFLSSQSYKKKIKNLFNLADTSAKINNNVPPLPNKRGKLLPIETNEQRSSTTSTSSRESTNSAYSYTSGIDVDERLPKVMEYDPPPPVPSRRNINPTTDELYLTMDLVQTEKRKK